MGGHGATYLYQPINASEEARILRLEPGSFAEPLIGSLVVRKIGDEDDEDEDEDEDEEHPPAYDCVSYCWGPQEQFTSFDCDGKVLRVTAAVDEMLRYMREPIEPRYLWIDASKCLREPKDSNHTYF